MPVESVGCAEVVQRLKGNTCGPPLIRLLPIPPYV